MSEVQVLKVPIKSKGDKKDYRLIKLANGIKALLVQKTNENPESGNESLAAANVSIKIGSFDNPPDALGLAHFLEHMVHMGSERYPDESGYNDFLSANGGKRNAITSSEYTTYFFSTSEKVFPEALDRLEQMIEAPLLSKNPMQREREAVDSEYEMKKSHDAVRVESILKHLIKDGHPAKLFDFGNLKTLKGVISDDELHSKLMELHAKYVGKKIFVAVQSERSLDELQELVVKSFSSIKSGYQTENDNRPQTTQVIDIFKPEFTEKIYFIKPKTTKKAFMMTWVLPSIHPHYKCSPLDYLAYVFKNEGEGGISTYLKQRHLATDSGLFMQENAFVSNSMFALVRVVCDMTNHGAENVDNILEAIFSYLLMLKETSIEDHRQLYNELVEKSAIDYDFHEESSPMNNVTDFAKNMLMYDDVDTVRGASIYQKFDDNAIMETIEALNERKFNLIFLTDKHDAYTLKEKYFGTEYDEVNFPEDYQRLWDERKINPEFYLEQPNPFKTTNFKIYEAAEESTLYPVKILDNMKARVWHKLDNKFKLPHVYYKVQFISPMIKTSIKNSLAMKVFTKLLEFHLKKKLSQASSAGYGLEIDSGRNALILKFSGYNDKISMLIDIVTSFLKNCIGESDDNTFRTVKEDLKEIYFEKLTNAIGFNGDYFAKILLEQHFTRLDYYHMNDDFTFEDLRQFSSKFFKYLKLEILAQGNITKSQALSVLDVIEGNLKFEPLPEEMELKTRSYQLPFGSNVIRMKTMMPNDDNSIIKNFYQIGQDTIRTRNLTRLIEAILNPKAYDFLRSKEQLGYGVACQVEEKGGLIGLNVLVLSQEGKNPYKKVCEKMEVFMNEIAKKTIEELTDEEFAKFRDARIKQMFAENLDLNVETSKHWSEISEHDYIFDRFALSAEDTKKLTKTDLQEFFESFTQPENIRMLSVQVIGTRLDKDEDPSLNDINRELKVEFIPEKISENENVIKSIDDFRSQLYLHPIVREVV